VAKARKARKSKSSGGGKWIQKAISKPGALTRQARVAGQSVQQFAQAHKRSPGTLGKRSRLALTLKKLPRHHGPR
jgi:hypothetical protein